MQSVLEISTDACRNVARGRRPARGPAPARARDAPSARASRSPRPARTRSRSWEDQRIVERAALPRDRRRARFVARQELLFGLHVHVGIDDPEKAIHVANGMRVHLPILLALSANSPFWRGDATGLMSTRTPIFKLFPRVGVPPRFESWERLSAARRRSWSTPGWSHDYTFLWWDVRPHPNLGTVEIRACDAQTRLEHTVALAALVQAMCKELAEHYEAGDELGTYPHEMLEENKWLAARYGLEGELVDLPRTAARARRRSWPGGCCDAPRAHARGARLRRELEGVEDLLERGNGAARQLVVYEANRDLRELMAEIVARTAAAD